MIILDFFLVLTFINKHVRMEKNPLKFVFFLFARKKRRPKYILCLCHRLASENDVKAFQQKLREMEKSNDELNAKLAKKERECEVRLQEKVHVTLDQRYQPLGFGRNYFTNSDYN